MERGQSQPSHPLLRPVPECDRDRGCDPGCDGGGSVDGEDEGESDEEGDPPLETEVVPDAQAALAAAAAAAAEKEKEKWARRRAAEKALDDFKPLGKVLFTLSTIVSTTDRTMST